MGLPVSDADQPPLDRIMGLFALSKTELGALFGVGGEAIGRWKASRMPPDRLEKLGDILALADLLERRLKPDRIAATVRRPADAYGGRTMLDLISAGEQTWLLDDALSTLDRSQST